MAGPPHPLQGFPPNRPTLTPLFKTATSATPQTLPGCFHCTYHLTSYLCIILSKAAFPNWRRPTGVELWLIAMPQVLDLGLAQRKHATTLCGMKCKMSLAQTQLQDWVTSPFTQFTLLKCLPRERCLVEEWGLLDARGRQWDQQGTPKANQTPRASLSFCEGCPFGVEVSGVRSGESLQSVQPPPTSPSPPGLTRSVYPGAVPIQLPLNLLLAPQFHECSPVLHSFSLFGKFPVGKGNRIH